MPEPEPEPEPLYVCAVMNFEMEFRAVRCCCVINQNYATKRATRHAKGLICVPHKTLKRCPTQLEPAAGSPRRKTQRQKQQQQHQEVTTASESVGQSCCPVAALLATGLPKLLFFFHCCTFTVINFNTQESGGRVCVHVVACGGWWEVLLHIKPDTCF